MEIPKNIFVSKLNITTHLVPLKMIITLSLYFNLILSSLEENVIDLFPLNFG